MALAQLTIWGRGVGGALLALLLVTLALPTAPALASAGQAESAKVVTFYGSGAAIVRNDEGEVYGVVYAGMDGSQPSQNEYDGFHDYASQAHGMRIVEQTVRVEPTSIMGQTEDGMLVVVGHLFLPNAEVPIAADLLGSGLGWYHPDSSNPYDGLYSQLEAVAQAQRNGVWGWSTAVPNLGSTPPPPTHSSFATRPVPASIAEAWDVLINSANGAHFAGIVERSGVRFRMTALSDSWAAFSPSNNLILLDRTLADESPLATAAVLAHEITHAGQNLGPNSDCVQAEVEAFAVQAQVWAELTGDNPPTETDLEQQLTLVGIIYEEEGEAGLTELISNQFGYQQQCGLPG